MSLFKPWIKPSIGHLKYDHRLHRNHLKGTEGDAINVTLAAAVYRRLQSGKTACLDYFHPANITALDAFARTDATTITTACIAALSQRRIE